MSQALAPTSIEWPECYYQQEAVDHWEVPFGRISDSVSDHSASFGDDFFPGSDTMLTTSSVTEDSSFGRDNSRTTNATIPVQTPENSSPVSNDMSPKATIAKQGKRRSRASRRTPTTLLHASIKNFRTLVQQYTGCQNGASALKSGRGPITLSFGGSSSCQQNDFPATSLTASLGHGGHFHTDEQSQFQQNQLHYHQQHLGNLGWQG